MEEMYVCFEFTTSTPTQPSPPPHHHPLPLSPFPPPPNSSLISPYDDYFATSFHDQHHQNHYSVFRSDPSSLFSISSSISSSSTSDGDVSSVLRSRIAAHPLYPVLVDSYIDCQKVGAPSEIAHELEEIRRDNDLSGAAAVTTCFGADPELDEFMEWYCDILAKYRTDLAKPFDEAMAYLNSMEAQLNSLCSSNNNGSVASLSRVSDEVGGGSSEEDLSGGESADVMELHHSNGEEQDLKDKLLRKYSGYISSLKHEFSKKNKKGKLPKDAKQMLLGWWSEHYKWPYPTESDKIALAECTGLDQKQINNWFINQRKRHWKPAENIQFAMMDRLCGPLYTNE